MRTHRPQPTSTIDGTGRRASRPPGDGGLSTTGSRLAWTLALVMVTSMALGLAAAGAAPYLPAASDGSRAAVAERREVEVVQAQDGLEAEWDGPTTRLDWTGATYTTVEASFVGDRVVVPGDQVRRTLGVQNTGPRGGLMTVGLRLDDPAPPAGVAGSAALAAAVELHWEVEGALGSVRVEDLVARGGDAHVVAEVPVPRWQTADVTVGFDVPLDGPDFRSQGAALEALGFSVVVQMSEDPEAPFPRTLGLLVTPRAVHVDSLERAGR